MWRESSSSSWAVRTGWGAGPPACGSAWCGPPAAASCGIPCRTRHTWRGCGPPPPGRPWRARAALGAAEAPALRTQNQHQLAWRLACLTHSYWRIASLDNHTRLGNLYSFMIRNHQNQCNFEIWWQHACYNEIKHDKVQFQLFYLIYAVFK